MAKSCTVFPAFLTMNSRRPWGTLLGVSTKEKSLAVTWTTSDFPAELDAVAVATPARASADAVRTSAERVIMVTSGSGRARLWRAQVGRASRGRGAPRHRPVA